MRSNRFNPRTCERCDNHGQLLVIDNHLFQSTHLREVRHSGHQRGYSNGGFNPRTCERCDYTLRHKESVTKRVSIHAPARGATRIGRIPPAGAMVSIHAPARGATPIRVSSWIANLVSIHAPARGATYR